MRDLTVRGVEKSFAGHRVLRGVDLVVPHGSFTAILGASGSGKTTLLRVVAGFERPDAGEVRLGGEVVDDSGHRFVSSERRRIGYVPQEGALFPHLSVGRNVGFGLARRGNRRERIDQLLELVGLSGYRRRYPHQLSGGQQQLVGVARAVIQNPKLILADEPTGNLHSAQGEEIMELFKRLNDAGTTIIQVTHSEKNAAYGNRIIQLRDGWVVSQDTSAAAHTSQ
jgi:iron(III) transport system ATP-binding protein